MAVACDGIGSAGVPWCSNVVSGAMLLVLLLLVMLLGRLWFLVVFSLHSGDGYDAGGKY